MKNKIPFILIAIILASFIYCSLNQLGFAFVDDKWMLLDERLIQVNAFNWGFYNTPQN